MRSLSSSSSAEPDSDTAGSSSSSGSVASILERLKCPRPSDLARKRKVAATWLEITIIKWTSQDYCTFCTYMLVHFHVHLYLLDHFHVSLYLYCTYYRCYSFPDW